MKETKSRYYEAIERQSHAERALRGHLMGDPDQVGSDDSTGELPELSAELGGKLLAALLSGFEWLARLNDSPGTDGPIRKDLQDRIAGVEHRLDSVLERLEQWESRFTSIEAGLRRIDRFTLEALQEIDHMRQNDPGRAGAETFPSGRLPKEETARLALEAAQHMQSEGKRLTLAAVARRAGLKYGQIVYAFGNREGFFQALDAVHSTAGTHGGDDSLTAAASDDRLADEPQEQEAAV